MSIDADLDLSASGSLSINLGKLSASVDVLGKKMDEQIRLSAYPRQLPLYQSFTANGFYDAGGPQMGRFWEVRLFGVTGLSTPGLAAWVVGGTPPVVTLYEAQSVTSLQLAAGILPPSQVRWQLNALPAWENFSGDQCRINQNQHLIVGVSNIPATTALYVVVVINDIPINRAGAVLGAA